MGLKWTDIDPVARTVTVRRRVNRVGRGQGGLLVRDGAKSRAGERTISLPQLVIDSLQRQADFQTWDRKRAPDRWVDSGFIFTSQVGTVLEPRRVDEYFAKVRERAGLGNHTFHGLRHDFAGLMLTNGISPRVVMEMMGHSAILA